MRAFFYVPQCRDHPLLKHQWSVTTWKLTVWGQEFHGQRPGLTFILAPQWVSNKYVSSQHILKTEQRCCVTCMQLLTSKYRSSWWQRNWRCLSTHLALNVTAVLRREQCIVHIMGNHSVYASVQLPTLLLWRSIEHCLSIVWFPLSNPNQSCLHVFNIFSCQISDHFFSFKL